MEQPKIKRSEQAKEGFNDLLEFDRIKQVVTPDSRYLSVKGSEELNSDRDILLDNLRQYFQAPAIEDDFSDHQARRDWRTTLAEKDPRLADLYERNQIRLNKIAGVLGTAEFFSTDLDDNLKDRLVKLQAEIGQMKDQYDQLPFSDKLKLVKSIAEFAFDLYQNLKSKEINQT